MDQEQLNLKVELIFTQIKINKFIYFSEFVEAMIGDEDDGKK